jgi:MYXO-CTERM domain-containing protein
MRSILSAGVAIIFACSVGQSLLLPSSAQAIVLIDDFDTPDTDANFAGAGTGNVQYKTAGISGPLLYTPYFDNGQRPGDGTIGNMRRLATEGSVARISVNGSDVGEPGHLHATGSGASLASANQVATLVLDGAITATTDVNHKPSITFGAYNNLVAPTITTSANINSASGIPGTQKDLIHAPGDPDRGVMFTGLSGYILGNASMRMAVFSGSAYAFFELKNVAVLPSAIYVPFRGFDAAYAADPNTIKFTSSTGNYLDLTNIFHNVTAIVLQFATNGGIGSYDVSIDSIYTHTPEPASVAIWGLLGVAAAFRRRRGVKRLLADGCASETSVTV